MSLQHTDNSFTEDDFELLLDNHEVDYSTFDGLPRPDSEYLETFWSPRFILTECNLHVSFSEEPPQTDDRPLQSRYLLVLGDGTMMLYVSGILAPKAYLNSCGVCHRISFCEDGKTPCEYCLDSCVWPIAIDQLSRQILKKSTGEKFAELLAPAKRNREEVSKTWLFDPQRTEQLHGRNHLWQEWVRRLSGNAKVHQWPDNDSLDQLRQAYPNFADVCALLDTRFKLSQFRPSKAIALPNLLLVGPPAAGKTSFVNELARILFGGERLVVNMGQSTPNFALVGSDMTFTNGKPGRILEALASHDSPVRNPLVVLDEIDKISTEARHDPLPALLALLEKADAKTFTDEYLGFPVDASGVNFIALANDVRRLPEPLLSRFMVVPVEPYTRSQMVEVVIPRIYHRWTEGFHEGTFPSGLDRGAAQRIFKICDGLPRQVESTLDRLAAEGDNDLFPRPTFEVLNGLTDGGFGK